MDYPYTPEWKEAVHRNSEAWLLYQAALGHLRQYFRNKLQYGKGFAANEFQVSCHLIGKNGVSGLEQATRLRETFMLVGKVEGAEIEAEVVGAIKQVSQSASVSL